MAGRKPLRFGLLGAGLIAPFHAKSIRDLDGCELVAIADASIDRARKRAEEFGCKAYGSLEQLLADDSIDAVCVLLPNHLHAAPAIATAQAGKHVLVEKPPAMSLADVDRMIAAAKASGVKLGIMLNCRVRKAIAAMKQAVIDGRFGQLRSASAYMKWHRTDQYYQSENWRQQLASGAGVTIQHAFHYIDLIHQLVGPVESVQARMFNLGHPTVKLEDTLQAFLNFRGGVVGSVEASTAYWPGCDVRIELYGENGTAIMVGERIDTWSFKDSRSEDDAIRQIGRQSVGTGASDPAGLDYCDHRTVIEGFAEAIRRDTEPLITAESARGTLEIALAMYKSSRLNQPVHLPLVREDEVWQ